MDLHVQNLRTGESVALDPDRTLIGTAEHAAVRTADGGPFLAALVVRYPDGWVVHGLSPHRKVRFNRQPLPAGRRATPRPGDVMEVGGERFLFHADAAAGEFPPPPADDARPPAF